MGTQSGRSSVPPRSNPRIDLDQPRQSKIVPRARIPPMFWQIHVSALHRVLVNIVQLFDCSHAPAWERHPDAPASCLKTTDQFRSAPPVQESSAHSNTANVRADPRIRVAPGSGAYSPVFAASPVHCRSIPHGSLPARTGIPGHTCAPVSPVATGPATVSPCAPPAVR